MRRSVALLALLALSMTTVAMPVTAQEELGSISGTVTDADTGEPIAGETVSVTGPGYGGATTAADGSYTVTNLPPGWYRIAAGAGIEMMESDWVGEYFDDRPDWASADQVKLDAGDNLSGIDLELVFGGVIDGQVTDAWTGEPIQYVYPSLERDFPRWGWSQIGSGGQTGEDGRYRHTGLDGEYRITVWSDDYLQYQSDVITIEPGTTTTLDIVLTPAQGSPFASVYGRACVGVDCFGPEVDLSAFAGRTVVAERPDGTELGRAVTDAWGWFQLEGLEPGIIVIRLAEPAEGMELLAEPRLELGPNESAWDVSLAHRLVPVRFELTAAGPSNAVAADSLFDVIFTLAVVADGVSFEVSDTSVQIWIPSDLEVAGYTSDGPFEPDSGLWVSDPSADRPTSLTLTLRADEAGEVRIFGEVDSARWPDPGAVFGDGQGEDFASVQVEIVDQVVGPPIDQPVASTGGEIRGVVYLDEDADGVRDDSESGVSGIAVVLIGTVDSRLPTTTDSRGAFVFDDVVAGSYRIEVVTGADQMVTTADHLLTLASGSVLAGVHIGVGDVPAAVPAWIFLTAGLLIVGLAGLVGFRLGRSRDNTPQPSPDRPLVEVGTG